MNRSFVWRKFSLLLVFFLASSLLLSGCGSDSYEDPTTPLLTATPNSLIEPATLKEWFDLGLVNAPIGSSERVVILTVTSGTNYTANHIPRSLIWDSGTELSTTRMEGLANQSTMVLPGSAMDTLIQRSGIDENTTIVISHSGTNMMSPSRAYYNLRYWGFPKERIKLLNGGDAAWGTAVTDNSWDPAIYGLTATVPTVTASTFSVRRNGVVRTDMRYSLGEMLQSVDRNDPYFILDARGGTDYTNGYISGAIRDDHAAYYSGTGFKPIEGVGGLREYLANLGVDGSETALTYCVSGMRASVPFFILDGVFGWDVIMYDGSWGQWSNYRANDNLAPNDDWRTDLFGRSTDWAPATNSTLAIDPILNSILTDSADSRGNQIELEDEAYMSAGSSSGGGSIGGGSPSGC